MMIKECSLLIREKHVHIERAKIKRHPEATRKSYYVLSIEGSKKKISAHGL